MNDWPSWVTSAAINGRNRTITSVFAGVRIVADVTVAESSWPAAAEIVNWSIDWICADQWSLRRERSRECTPRRHDNEGPESSRTSGSDLLADRHVASSNLISDVGLMQWMIAAQWQSARPVFCSVHPSSQAYVSATAVAAASLRVTKVLMSVCAAFSTSNA